MPDESQGFQGKGRSGEEASQVSLVPDIMVISSDREGKITGGNIPELDDLSQTTDGIKQSAQGSDILQSGLGESQVFVELGVVKTAQAPEPLKANSLMRETGVTPQATDHNGPVNSSSDRLQTDNSTSPATDGCTKSSPGHACTSFTADLCDVELSHLDRSAFEKTNPSSPDSFSEPSLDTSPSSKNTQSSPDDNRGDHRTDPTVKPAAENSLSGGSPAVPDVSSSVHQTRDSFDDRRDEEDRDEDRRSTQSRRTVKEGMCCCYQAFHRAFLQCVEETPAMLSGLVLSLAFCVAIIVLIPTTGRVRHGESVCVCVRGDVHTFNNITFKLSFTLETADVCLTNTYRF